MNIFNEIDRVPDVLMKMTSSLFLFGLLTACSNGGNGGNGEKNIDSNIVLSGSWRLTCAVINGRIGDLEITIEPDQIIYDYTYGCTEVLGTERKISSYTLGNEIITSEGLSAVEINIPTTINEIAYIAKDIVAISDATLYFGQEIELEACDPDELIDIAPTIRPWCNQRPNSLLLERPFQRIE